MLALAAVPAAFMVGLASLAGRAQDAGPDQTASPAAGTRPLAEVAELDGSAGPRGVYFGLYMLHVPELDLARNS